MQNALIVGGQKRCWEPVLEYLGRCGVQIFDHWSEDKEGLGRRVPSKANLVIVIASQVSHALAGHARTEAERAGVPVVYTSHKFTKFPEELAKWGIKPQMAAAVQEAAIAEMPERTEPLVPLAAMLQSAALAVDTTPANVHSAQETKANEVQTQEVAVAKTNNQPLRKNQIRAAAKADYVKEVLRTNPFMSPDDVNKEVAAKFPGTHPSKPGGLAKGIIAKARMDLFGFRIGPGGRFFDRKGKLIRPEEVQAKIAGGAAAGGGSATITHPPPPPAPQGHVPASARLPLPSEVRTERRPEANVEASDERIRRLLGELKTAMAQTGIEKLEVASDGNVHVTQRVTQVAERSMKV